MGVVATGGLAPLFAGATDMIDKVDPDLTLWGLRLIYRRNTQPMNDLWYRSDTRPQVRRTRTRCFSSRSAASARSG